MPKKLKIWMPLVCLSIGVAIALEAAAASAVPSARPAAPDTRESAKAQPRPNPGLVEVEGRASGTLDLAGFVGDTVTFEVDASVEAATPWAADGSFDVTHVRPDGTVLADFGGTVECLMAGAGADVVVATGTITRGGAEGLPGEELGHQVGITISDHGRRDHLGWSWLVMGFHDAPPCMSTAPFFPIAEGNFRVDAPRVTPVRRIERSPFHAGIASDR